MSSIKLKHASGNAVSIAAPESNPASDRTLYVPSNADGTIRTTTTPGAILQVVQATSTSGPTSTSTTYATTGLEASITPTSTSNKVLIKMVSPMTGFAGGTEHNRGSLKVYRGGASGTSVSGILSTQYSEDDFYSDAVITFLDSPSTPSATTSTVMMARVNGSGEYSFNRDGAQTATLVLMEVAG